MLTAQKQARENAANPIHARFGLESIMMELPQ
jgi:hypothetical protein